MLIHLGRGLSRNGLPWYFSEKADNINPSLLVQFDKNRYAVNGAIVSFFDLFTFQRSGPVATYFDANGVMQTAAADVPRFDHDPETGAALGLLIEGQRTNLITNSNMNGASSSPSTLPTGWSAVAINGLTTTIVETGTYKGMKYVDVRINGTASGSYYQLSPNGGGYSASSGQYWTVSGRMRYVAGSASGINNVSFKIQKIGGSYSSSTAYLPTVTTDTLTYLTATKSWDDAYNARMLVHIDTTAGASIDYTFRIMCPQCEIGAFSSSFIPTDTGAITRTADICTNGSGNVVPFADWYNQSEGCFYASAVMSSYAASYQTIASVSAASATESLGLRVRGDNARPEFNIIQGGGTVTSLTKGSAITGGTHERIAASYKTNDAAVSFDGGAVGTDNTITPPSVDRLLIGNLVTYSREWFGTIKELRYYPIRVTNDELVRITTP